MAEPPAKKRRSLADLTVANSKLSAISSVEKRPEDCSSVFFPLSDGLKSSYKLFEVPKSFTQAPLEQIRIIGDENDSSSNAVLCTGDKTFAVKKVETSNSVFLVAPGGQEGNRFDIESLHHDYYELVETAPNPEALKKLLGASVYSSAASDKSNPYLARSLRTLEDLRGRVQASSSQLDEMLAALGAVEVDGFVRLIDPSALREATQQLLDSLLEGGWPLNSVSRQTCEEQMTSTDGRILDCVLRSLGECLGGDVWQLDGRAVARETARGIVRRHLGGGAQRVGCSDLESEWAALTPGAVECPPLECLQGIVLREEAPSSGPRPCYLLLDLDDVFTDGKALLCYLFTLRNSFTLEELTPLLGGVCGGAGQPSDEVTLLLQHATLVEGRYYCK